MSHSCSTGSSGPGRRATRPTSARLPTRCGTTSAFFCSFSFPLNADPFPPLQARSRERLDSCEPSYRRRFLRLPRRRQRLHHRLHDPARSDSRTLDDGRNRRRHDPRPGHVHLVLCLASRVDRRRLLDRTVQDGRFEPPDVHSSCTNHHRPCARSAYLLPERVRLVVHRRWRRMGSGDRHGELLHCRDRLLLR